MYGFTVNHVHRIAPGIEECLSLALSISTFNTKGAGKSRETFFSLLEKYWNTTLYPIEKE